MRRLQPVILSTASIAALCLSAPAHAQAPEPVNPTGDPCQAPAGSAAAEECIDLDGDGFMDTTPGEQRVLPQGETILVVGSRIRRDSFNTADPVQVLNREEYTSAGFNSTSEVLQSTAVTDGTAQINNLFGGFVVQGGPGVNTVSLRGLGTTRTLVLMNGRRVAPAGSRGSVGSADLNVLPNAMIDRIEVLNTGASSIYGSDAVAGVINIVTRTDVNGLIVEGQHNIAEEGYGGSERYSVVFGQNLDRLQFAASLEYYKRDPLTFGDREIFRCPTTLLGTEGGGGNFGAGDYVDPRTGRLRCFDIDSGGVTVNTIALAGPFAGFFFGDTVAMAEPVASDAPPGTIPLCNRFRPAPGAGGLVPGYECVGGLYFNPVTGAVPAGIDLNVRDTFAPSMLQQQVVSPVEIYTGFAQGSYEIDALGNAEIYAELLLNRRKSSQDQQRQIVLDYPLNSPLIPAEIRTGRSAGNSTAGYAYEARAFTDFGIYDNEQTVDFAKIGGGIRGDLPADWRYDFYGSKTWSDSEYTSLLVLTDKYRQSFMVNAAGTACTDPTGGCVPAPVMTHDIVGGNYRDTAWFDYVTAPVTGTTEYRETVFNLTLDGPIVRLPGGNLAAAVGVEYRTARIDDTPAEDSQNGNLFGFTSSTITRGSDSVWEAFAEVEAPLLSRVPFAYELTINGSARYTTYDSYGSDWTYKLGAIYAPVRWLAFRGSYGTSYRAPALFEQFLGATSGFIGAANDPCDELANETNPLIRERCLQEVPPNFIQNSSVRVLTRGGAETGLAAETSQALTFGGVFQPQFGSGFGELSLAVDYFNVEVENGVNLLGTGAVLNSCYATPERNFCNLVSRDPATNILTVTTSYVNISEARVEGIDYVARYARDLGPGRIRLGASLTQFLQRYNLANPEDEIIDVIGLLNNPEWTGTFDAAYSWEQWQLRWAMEWIDGVSSNARAEEFGFDPDIFNLTVDDYFLHSLSLRYSTEDFGLTLGVRNLLDRDPPRISGLWINRVGDIPLYSGYDFNGRTFFVNATVRF